MNQPLAFSSSAEEDVYYPESDEALMGETDFHMMAFIWLRQALEDYFAAQSTVYVASDMFLYYVQGHPEFCRAPDVMIVKGVERRFRRVFKSWVEKAIPCTVFEVVSERSAEEDTGPKVVEYARIGIKEYYLFDPEGKYLEQPLMGYRQRAGEYVPQNLSSDGTLTSKELGLVLRAEGLMLRLLDARTGEPVLTRTERSEGLAAEVERLRDELTKIQGGPKSPRGRGKKKSS